MPIEGPTGLGNNTNTHVHMANERYNLTNLMRTTATTTMTTTMMPMATDMPPTVLTLPAINVPMTTDTTPILMMMTTTTLKSLSLDRTPIKANDLLVP